MQCKRMIKNKDKNNIQIRTNKQIEKQGNLRWIEGTTTISEEKTLAA